MEQDQVGETLNSAVWLKLNKAKKAVNTLLQFLDPKAYLNYIHLLVNASLF